MSQDDTTAKLARQLLQSLNLDEQLDPELAQTPERVTKLYHELFWGIAQAPPTVSIFDVLGSSTEPVVVCALPFRSMCVHHLLPFFGAIDIAFEPDAKLIGFGSLGRIIDYFAARPQIQERLVQQLQDYIVEQVSPKGVLVRCRARQLCVEYRGDHKRGELTSVVSYGSLSTGERRAEVMQQFIAAQRPL